MQTTPKHPSPPQRRQFHLVHAALAAAATLAMSACGGGDMDEKAEGTIATKKKAYTVGGAVGFSGPASGTVTLRVTAVADGSTNDVVVANNAPASSSYTFDKAFFKKDRYAVAVVDSGSYQCLFTGSPTGQIDKANVTNVTLFCSVPPPNFTIDFTVLGAPTGSSLTAAYFNVFTGEPVLKSFTIGADGSTYSFDESLPEGLQLQFGIVQNPAGYACASNTQVMVVNVLEPVVTCSPVPSAN
jgi:hypothetical protein